MARKMKDGKKLSKHLLEMKFMKASRDRILEEEDEESSKAFFFGHSNALNSSSSRFIVEPSWVACEGLKYGRKSFRGMNPAIEKIMDLENSSEKIPKLKEEDVDVTVEEMADIYRQKSTLIESTKSLKRSNENSSPMNKRKFLKPADD